MQSAWVLFLICAAYGLCVNDPYVDIEMEKTISYIIPSESTRGHPLSRKESSTKLLRTDIQKVIDSSHFNPLGYLGQFHHILIVGLLELNACSTKLEVGDTWEHHVMSTVNPDYLEKISLDGMKRSVLAPGKESSTPGKKCFPPDNTNKSLRVLADKFKSWYIHSAKQFNFQNDRVLVAGSLDKITQWNLEDLTPEEWNLAVRFYHLSIMWKRKMLIHDIVTQMAIFGHFGKDPNPIPETITQIYGDGITGFDKASMRRLHEWTFFQYVGNSIKYQSQEYFVVRELVALCRKQAPTMKLRNSMFWEDLDKIANEEQMQPFLRAYRDLCNYFKNGTPLGKTFEYYQTISHITLELIKFRVDETKKLNRTPIIHLPGASGDIQESQLWPFAKRPLGKIESSVLIDKLNLFMNYASEHDQFKKKWRERFFPFKSPSHTISNSQNSITALHNVFTSC
ncbi:hypothetical protein PCANC_15335 [Puccinia coronata f. sp. avenae]|uniref:Uncharacterized protein n=1 Tax=Puccinia coronata f. sp. avenae TaxID=200324 RepID=A0A2N5SXC2_9BASI|nr:hypothetical protein PCANC_15335 [Puccinia coronata f. sp. avenae]